MLIQVRVVNPFELQGNFAFGALHQLHTPTVCSHEPTAELDTVTDRSGEQHDSGMTREHPEAKLPHDPSFWIVKRMKFVHHYRGHRVKRFWILHESIEQNLGNHHQNGRVRIDFSIACNQSNTFGWVAPSRGGFLDLGQLLIG